MPCFIKLGLIILLHESWLHQSDVLLADNALWRRPASAGWYNSPCFSKVMPISLSLPASLPASHLSRLAWMRYRSLARWEPRNASIFSNKIHIAWLCNGFSHMARIPSTAVIFKYAYNVSSSWRILLFSWCWLLFFILHWLIIVHLKCRCPHFPWQRRGDACSAQAYDRAEPPNDDEHMAKGFGRHKRSPSVLQPHLPLHHRGAERNDPFVLNLQLLPPLVVVDLIMPLILSCLVTLTWLQLTSKSSMAISFRGAYESFLFSLSFKNFWCALNCLNAC